MYLCLILSVCVFFCVCVCAGVNTWYMPPNIAFLYVHEETAEPGVFSLTNVKRCLWSPGCKEGVTGEDRCWARRTPPAIHRRRQAAHCYYGFNLPFITAAVRSVSELQAPAVSCPVHTGWQIGLWCGRSANQQQDLWLSLFTSTGRNLIFLQFELFI